jgi:predicted ABC-type sugar transport system permease subunit
MFSVIKIAVSRSDPLLFGLPEICAANVLAPPSIGLRGLDRAVGFGRDPPFGDGLAHGTFMHPAQGSWMLRGLALALSNGTQVTGMPLQDPIIWYLGGGKILGLPVSVVLLIVVGVVLALIIHKTPFASTSARSGRTPTPPPFPESRSRPRGAGALWWRV